MKTFLKAFSQQYRLEEDLDLQEIKWCMEIVENERQKADIAARMEKGKEVEDDQSGAIDPLVHAQVRRLRLPAATSDRYPVHPKPEKQQIYVIFRIPYPKSFQICNFANSEGLGQTL